MKTAETPDELTTDCSILFGLWEAMDDSTILLTASDDTEIKVVLGALKMVEEPISLLNISVVEVIEIAEDSKAPVDCDSNVLDVPLPDTALLTGGAPVLDSARVDDGWIRVAEPDSEFSIEVDGITDKNEPLWTVDGGWNEDTEPDSEISNDFDDVADKKEPLSTVDEAGNGVAEIELGEIGDPSELVVQVSGGQYP